MTDIIELDNDNAHPEMFKYFPCEIMDVRLENGSISRGWKILEPFWRKKEQEVEWRCWRAGDGYTYWKQSRLIPRWEEPNNE